MSVILAPAYGKVKHYLANRHTGGYGALVPDSTDLLRPHEVIEILGISDATLRRWTQLGHIPVVRVGPQGHRKYRREDVQRLLEPSVGQ